MLSPASRNSMSDCTGTRVPVKTGVPPIMSLEVVTSRLLMVSTLPVRRHNGKLAPNVPHQRLDATRVAHDH